MTELQLVYRRLSATPPPVRDQLVLGADGVLRAWLSNGPVVGRFRVGDAETAEIRSLAEAARSAPVPAAGTVPPDALFELVEVGDAVLRTGADADVPGPWGELLARCRRTIAQPGEPVAAVTVETDPAGLRLEHRGSDSLRVGLGALVATIVAYRDGTEVASASTRITDGVAEAEPGWSLSINLDPVPADGLRRVASVSFSASDGGVWIPVLCEVVLGDRR